ncbi:glycine cleavage system protein GcvH [Thermosporothrix hazakensis]|uniref:glycine cleavage system protein GcvH n=1 Tax=Thermosporothrix hazakensis TaxID=644383 RepID=UPI000DAB439F
MNHPENLKYTKTDEWIRLEGDVAVIGVTDYAQDQLGDIVYIELPWDGGEQLDAGAKFGDIESVKATSELVSPVSGQVIEANAELKEHPELINDSPYEQGWMLKIKLNDPSEVDQLLSAEDYLRHLQGR